MQLIRYEPETRWWWRFVLRRRTRATVIACQVPTNFSFERNFNGFDSHLTCTVEGTDALELYARYGSRVGP
jgi:hypothetical protein